MITIREAEEILKKEYHIDNFLYMVNDLILPDFKADKHEIVFNNSIFESVTELGVSQKCEVTVYEVLLKEGAQNRRVAITQEMFRILRGQGINNAIVAFANADKRNYRLSLLTSKYEFDGNKVVKVLSNPRRYSYSLGYGTKTKTAYDFLISKGKVHSLDELINRFSVEVVNKQFYNEIALSFTKLIGGKRESTNFEKELNLYGVTNQNKYAEFAVRLIGRIVFCWFLKEKKSEAGIPLVPDNMLSIDAIKNSTNYYHDVLEPLFFELLNTNQNRRKNKFINEDYYKQIPYLNGGLFSPHVDDRYKFDMATGGGQYGVVTIENGWFEHFIGVLSQYNFTVDENTSYDIELSIDPEMLGRIFENLLAEINPETGENAKKSTGSFYTPRDIVDYMVDNSILEYLKTKTGLDETRLKALISYSKEDDDIASFTNFEKKAIISALYTVTVLDPACGSGAFPIGMLQKIVYMLQEIDPEANLWFDEIVKGAPIYVRKAFEEKFSNGELDYIRKLTVIEKSIYGVDIQPIAVEIARLRCFLSLVIEQKVNDTLPNRGVHPLPSLDFKFLIANSLIKLPDDSSYHMGQKFETLSMFENVSHIDELKAVREEYFNADNERKFELREEFADIQKRMFQQTLSMAKNASPRYSALSNWSPFKNEPTDWFDAEWMFGVKDGFDIVIGNPPYVLLQGENKSNNINYFKKSYIVAKYKIDLYHLFIEKSIKSLCKEGICSLITPSNFTTNNYCYALRRFMLEQTNIRKIVYYDENVFTANVNNLVFLLKKSFSPNNTIYFSHVKRNGDSWSSYGNSEILQTAFMNNQFLLIPPSNTESSRIIIKMEDNATIVKEVARVNFGMQLRDRTKFPLDVTTDKTKLTQYHIKCYTGKDIIPYGATIENRWCYFNREAKCGGCWDEIVQLSKPKLLIRQIGEYPIVGIDTEGYPLLNTGFIISAFTNIDIYFLLGLLNSKVIKFYWLQKYADNRKQFPKIKGGYLERLPFQRNYNIEQQIIALTQRMLKGGPNISEEIQKQLDGCCYALYNLTPEEIALVEESVK